MLEPSESIKETYRTAKLNCLHGTAYLHVSAVAIQNEKAIEHIWNAQKELMKACAILESNGFEIEDVE